MKPITTRLSRLVGDILAPVRDPFSRDATGLAEATNTQVVELTDGAVLGLTASAVRKRIGDAQVKMLAYNGSIPGPTLKVTQGSEVTIEFTNAMELDTTVHWHGLRLDHRFDGVPEGEHHGMQPAIPPRGNFTYRLRFPDAGLYWYHPHIREDYTQEHGMYGNIIVVPSDPSYWAPVNREFTLVLDDIFMEGDQVAPFSQSTSNHSVMGRFGNVMLLNGETFYTLNVNTGEVVRLYLTNTANVRSFAFRIEGARLKLVGGDNGRVEREEFVEEVVISPSERAIVDVYVERPGRYSMEHRTPKQTYTLGEVAVAEQPCERPFETEFFALRANQELVDERASSVADLNRPPDKTLALVGEMGGHGNMGGHSHDGIEWEEKIALHNRISTPEMMHWKLVDRETGAANHDIEWSFKTGERVKVRLVNEPHADHPMQHPIHFHGQRFLVLSRDGVPNPNLAWKDTVLVHTGETVDILLDASNPGLWMAHCHIAEHVEGGMMFNYLVTDHPDAVMAHQGH